jgi:hypothetical protein
VLWSRDTGGGTDFFDEAFGAFEDQCGGAVRTRWLSDPEQPVVFFGGSPSQLAAALAASGLVIIDALISFPPVPEKRQKKERRRLRGALDGPKSVEVSRFFAHALTHLEFLESLERVEAAGTPEEECAQDLLEEHYPLSEHDQKAIGEASEAFGESKATFKKMSEMGNEPMDMAWQHFQLVCTDHALRLILDSEPVEGDSVSRLVTPMQHRHFWNLAERSRCEVAVTAERRRRGILYSPHRRA